jgi:hypothetical protein
MTLTQAVELAAVSNASVRLALAAPIIAHTLAQLYGKLRRAILRRRR